jgi:hypothetical protein
MNERITAKQVLIYLSALAVSILPVTVAILSYFPVWRAMGGEYLLSGLTLCLILLALIPGFKALRALLRSPAAYMIWAMVFLLFFSLSKIGDQMTVIAFVGTLSNLIGAILFKISGVGNNGKK